MSREERIWKLAALLVGLAAAAPGFLGLQQQGVQEKHLTASTPNPTNLLGQLSALGNDAEIRMSIRREPLRNIVFLTATLKNDGAAPILPNQYSGDISLNVNSPWQFVAVANTPNQTVNPAWAKLTDQQYVATPQLLNRGEQIAVNVYLTDPNTEIPTASDLQGIAFHWGAHIEDLDQIDTPNTSAMVGLFSGVWGLGVVLYGWNLISFAILATAFLVGYLYLLSITILVRNKSRWLNIGYISTAAIVSVSAAESITSYVMPSLYYYYFPPTIWYNLPPILVNGALLGYLVWLASTKRSEFGVEVRSPISASRVAVPFRIVGTIGRLPPKGWELRLFTTNVNQTEFWPQPFEPVISGYDWHIDFDNHRASPGTVVLFQLFMVGPEGLEEIARWRVDGEQTGKWPAWPAPPDQSIRCTNTIKYFKDALNSI